MGNIGGMYAPASLRVTAFSLELLPMSSQALRKSVSMSHFEPESLRPLDLVYLSHQTFGDRALEVELLTLFERQARQIMAQIAMSTAATNPGLRQDLVHTLKGSARAVGARQVAASAQDYEDVLTSGAGEVRIAAAGETLAVAVSEACTAVAELLAEI